MSGVGASGTGSTGGGGEISSRELSKAFIDIEIQTPEGRVIKPIRLDKLKQLAKSQHTREGEAIAAKVDLVYRQMSSSFGGQAGALKAHTSAGSSISRMLSGSTGSGDTASRIESATVRSFGDLFNELKKFALAHHDSPTLQNTDVYTDLDHTRGENVELRKAVIEQGIELAQKGAAISSLSSQVEALELENSGLHQLLTTTIEKFEEKEIAMTKTLEEQSRTIDAQAEEIKGLEAHIQKLQKTRRAHKAHIRRATAKLDAAKDTIRELRQQRNILRGELYEAKKAHVEQVAELGDQIQGLQSTVRAKNIEIRHLRQEQRDLKAANSALQEELTRTSSNLRTVTLERDRLTTENRQLKGQLDSSEKSLGEARSDLALTKAELTKSIAHLGTIDTVVGEALHEVQSLQRAIDALPDGDAGIAPLEERKRVAQEKVGAGLIELQNARSKIRDLKADITRQSDTIRGLKEERDALRDDLADAQIRVAASKLQVAQLRRSISSRDATITERDLEIAHLREQLADALNSSQSTKPIPADFKAKVNAKYREISCTPSEYYREVGNAYELCKSSPLLESVMIENTPPNSFSAIWERLNGIDPGTINYADVDSQEVQLLDSLGLTELFKKSPEQAQIVFYKAGIEALEAHGQYTSIAALNVDKIYESDIRSAQGTLGINAEKSKDHTGRLLAKMRETYLDLIKEKKRIPTSQEVTLAMEPQIDKYEKYGGMQQGILCLIFNISLFRKKSSK